VSLLNTRKAQELFAQSWVETVGSSPAQTAVYIKSDMAKWGRLIKDAGIREE
jgi:tripartite-type tricarboxylate transporter receptor subunit TctC